MKPVILDLEKMKVVEMNGKVLRGRCVRCGRCCYNIYGEPCEYIFIDSWMDEERTKPIVSCKLQNKKPISCTLYPLSDESIRKGCGFHWENK